MNEDGNAGQAKPRRSAPWIGLAVLAGAVAGVAAIYGIAGIAGNQESAACPGAAAVSSRLDPLVKGEVAALSLAARPQPMPTLSFLQPDGKATSLADFRGKTVLLNLWATWCIPCRKEMPALNALQKTLGGKDLDVVAVNIDTRNPDRIAAFLEEAGVDKLVRYTDPTTGVFQTLKNEGLALGLPTTVLIDAQGCRLGVMSGGADWSGEEAKKVIEAVIKPAGA